MRKKEEGKGGEKRALPLVSVIKLQNALTCFLFLLNKTCFTAMKRQGNLFL